MKVSQLNLKDDMIEKFSVKDLLEKNIDELSGGELQKVAIVDCLSKDADIYLFDEPSAYLDVEERLNLANFCVHLQEKRKKHLCY
jgi:ATP-binding cassette subfamily E protein 1